MHTIPSSSEAQKQLDDSRLKLMQLEKETDSSAEQSALTFIPGRLTIEGSSTIAQLKAAVQKQYPDEASKLWGACTIDVFLVNGAGAASAAGPLHDGATIESLNIVNAPLLKLRTHVPKGQDDVLDPASGELIDRQLFYRNYPPRSKLVELHITSRNSSRNWKDKRTSSPDSQVSRASTRSTISQLKKKKAERRIKKKRERIRDANMKKSRSRKHGSEGKGEPKRDLKVS